MAVKIGKEVSEGSFTLYKGIAGFNVLAVNPNKDELSKILERDIENEPEYLMKTEDGISQTRVVFYVRTAENSQVNGGINLTTNISFVITNAPAIGTSSGKCQVVDKYGRFAWVTKEEFTNHIKPQYSSGPANISAEYRQAFRGEEQLIRFLRQWLNIPDAANYKNGKWVEKEDQSDSEVSLNMDALLKGDVSELRTLVEAAPNFVVKAAVGIKTVEGEKGPRMYQSVFTRAFVKNSVSDYSRLDAEIVTFQQGGGAPNTIYSTQPLHEYKVEATEFSPEKSEKPTTSAPTPWD